MSRAYAREGAIVYLAGRRALPRYAVVLALGPGRRGAEPAGPDGRVAERDGLEGKPAPDGFLAGDRSFELVFEPTPTTSLVSPSGHPTARARPPAPAKATEGAAETAVPGAHAARTDFLSRFERTFNCPALVFS